MGSAADTFSVLDVDDFFTIRADHNDGIKNIHLISYLIQQVASWRVWDSAIFIARN